ncbi:acyl-CoA dehydrogenase family protein [Novosphingobium flavum]|uniref:3-sulfinopropanoyl-CoA desulfinase n=1 Tax=Novosphingobium aerophilum TaxID=2839843 RepID=A0A7X1F4P5_9SPHN|nr:acyl-CoA dehydrogenase family protein [Novosphingobium aerophilum]MBC2650352.1 acyl-CoA dehydrogenase family protein [Novosphingobium aerophilum]MBC2660313.1 acyl-CoA dehydrogenase family protein [Novosphingobium aerophilum]
MILSGTQRAVRDAVRDYAQAEIRPHSMAFEAAGAFPPGLFEQLAGLGLMGMTAPAAVGGAETDYVSYALALIELAAADGALSTVVSIQNSLIVGGLLKDGSAAQQARFLPDLVAGRMIGAFALTEPDAGSDASAIRTRAHRVEGGYRLTGAKQFITSGRIAGITIVFAATDPAAGKRGISAFIVPTDSPGYTVDKVEHKLGQAASDTCAIRLDDVFVPDDLMLGQAGGGYGIALGNLEAGRIGIAAQCIGMADAALGIAIDYARDRKSFGKPILEHQAVGFRLADQAAKLEAARQLVLHAAALKDDGQPCLKEASMAKLVASETAESVVSAALQTLGGYGYLEEYGVAKIYRDVRVCQIYEGTSDIQRMVIARAL